MCRQFGLDGRCTACTHSHRCRFVFPLSRIMWCNLCLPCSLLTSSHPWLIQACKITHYSWNTTFFLLLAKQMVLLAKLNMKYIYILTNRILAPKSGTFFSILAKQSCAAGTPPLSKVNARRKRPLGPAGAHGGPRRVHSAARAPL